MYGFTTEQVFNNTFSGSTLTWSGGTWSVGVPSAQGSNASFPPQSSPTTITFDGPNTVGHIQFDGLNAYTLSGTNTLTLFTDIGGKSILSTPAGSHLVATPVSLTSDAVKFGEGTLMISGNISGAGGVFVNKGTLALTGTNNYSGLTTVTGGILAGAGNATSATSVAAFAHLAPSAASTAIGTLSTGALTLAANAVLDFDLGTPGTGSPSTGGSADLIVAQQAAAGDLPRHRRSVTLNLVPNNANANGQGSAQPPAPTSLRDLYAAATNFNASDQFLWFFEPPTSAAAARTPL